MWGHFYIKKPYCLWCFILFIVYLRLTKANIINRTLRNIKYDDHSVRLARFAKALSHPARIIILKYMEKNKCCFVKDISEILPFAQSTISQHVKELKDAGLIRGEIEATKIKYCVDMSNWQIAKALFNNVLR